MARIHGTTLAVLLLALAATASWPRAAAADATAAQRCESGKNAAAGRYAACLYRTQQRFIAGGGLNTLRRNYLLYLCGAKYADSWQHLEEASPGDCPSLWDRDSVRQFIDACTVSVEGALSSGASLPLDAVACASALETCGTTLDSCLGDCAAGLRAPLKTGQTSCYDWLGSPIACAGTGQDGELQKGAARSFTDNGDGTITDNATNLMWEKLADDGSIHDVDTTYSWQDAFASKVATLNSLGFAGQHDWRVPNISELRSLVNLGATNPAVYPEFNADCLPGCTVLACSCTDSLNAGYWSSTTSHHEPDKAWGAGFSQGGAGPYTSKSEHAGVRAVRGG